MLLGAFLAGVILHLLPRLDSPVSFSRTYHTHIEVLQLYVSLRGPPRTCCRTDLLSSGRFSALFSLPPLVSPSPFYRSGLVPWSGEVSSTLS